MRAHVEHSRGCRKKPATENATSEHEEGEEESRSVMLHLGETSQDSRLRARQRSGSVRTRWLNTVKTEKLHSNDGDEITTLSLSPNSVLLMITWN